MGSGSSQVKVQAANDSSIPVANGGLIRADLITSVSVLPARNLSVVSTTDSAAVFDLLGPGGSLSGVELINRLTNYERELISDLWARVVASSPHFSEYACHRVIEAFPQLRTAFGFTDEANHGK